MNHDMKTGQTGVYIGRFQPLHDGHIACIKRILETSERCIVLIRDGHQDRRNPFSYRERVEMIRKHFPDFMKVGIQPLYDRDYGLSVYIGREVGYELIQLDEATEAIHASDLRSELYGANATASGAGK